MEGIGHGAYASVVLDQFHIQLKKGINMKFVVAAAIVASCTAFAPSQQSIRSVTSLNAERSKALPFMNRPALVSSFILAGGKTNPLGLKIQDLDFCF